MRQQLTALLVSLLVIGAVAAVPMSGAAQFTGTDSETSASMTAAANNTTDNETIAPGERLSGAIGVQNAELEGELETRTFGLKVAKANTDSAKAEVVASQLNQSQERLKALEQRLENLRQARQNGSMSKGEYAAKAAETKAKLNNVQTMANKTANVSEGIPNETLRAHGVNVTAIKTLQQRAAKLSGPEVASIAQTIAGDRGRAPANATERGNQTAGNQTATPTGTETPSGNETTTQTGGTSTTSGTDSGTQAGGRSQ